MKIFYFHGPNPKTQGGTSSKIWKIECRGREVHIWYAAADMIGRKTVVRGELRTHVVRHRTQEAARMDEAKRIKAQEAQNYYRKPRRR